ncbi:hypothetical protein EJ02DRAFT_168168 [Clathrospora elynae]|uniref:Alpha/beta hydrolase fold-3 domain-containing protein n=1 Tax=Clathrospora elynae TaxID=706981 RepID=A0A6A5SRL4_9PLEO|nr:hypothetical protein EJ02DRAFT_168168 [Clathrospora elynae]
MGRSLRIELGSPDAERVILHLHGGGYTQLANEGNLQYLDRLVKDLNADEAGCHSVAVLVLAYTPAPEATHPTQLREAATMLSHFVADTGRSEFDIIISGDSAGGSLAIAVLSHTVHAHPDVPAMRLLRPTNGPLLYSLWVSSRTDYPSFKNEEFDMLSPLSLHKWAAMFLNKANPNDPETDPGPVSGDSYTEACLNSASWWVGFNWAVSFIFISYGSHEVLADPIRHWKEALVDGWGQGEGDTGRVPFFDGLKQAHIAPIVDIMTPGKTIKTEAQVAIEDWYRFHSKKIESENR